MSVASLMRKNRRHRDIPLLYPGDHLDQPEFHQRQMASGACENVVESEVDDARKV